MATDAVSEFAPAKVNLTLHVTGRRADGYHLLDSLVVFASIGDRVTLRPAPELTLDIVGPQAAALPSTADNLVLRAARLMGGGAAITLDKVLPVASGIGGGSSDAAATLRAMARLTGQPLPAAAEVLGLGADVPVCLSARPTRMTGVGDGLRAVTGLPPVWLVLVNPGVALSTPEVFGALDRRDHAPMPDRLPDLATPHALADFLASQRNDLEPAARRIAPVIGDVLAALGAETGCLLARMSGSGATSFGLFADRLQAETAANGIAARWPGWWVMAAETTGQK